MRSQFYSLTVEDVRQETDDCVSIAFTIPEHSKDRFEFIPGQYLTLKARIDGEEVRRSYSICSGRNEPLRVAIKKMPFGLFSTYACEEIQIGDEMEVMPPMGKFVVDQSIAGGHHVGFAAGSGITPIVSMIQHILETDSEAQFSLFYGNRDSNSIIFKRLLEDLKDRYMHRLSLYHILTRERLEAPIFNGRINAEKSAALIKHFVDIDQTQAFYICGPSEMIAEIEKGLAGLGINNKKIRAERFSSPLDHKKQNIARERVDHHDGDSTVHMIIDGEETTFSLNYDGVSILDKALDQGADLPFACKGGVCCTCKAKLVDGDVQMVVNYGLEPDEIEAGYILTCQAHPTTENIIVSFDE